MRQPENPHDPNAVACHVDGTFVGFVPRGQAADLAKDMDAGKPVRAILVHR